MDVVDAQLHVWDHDRPDRSWQPAPIDVNEAHTRRFMETNVITYEAMAKTMEAGGVAAAILVTPGGLYGNDNRYAFDAARAMPNHFAVVARIDYKAGDIDRVLRELKGTPGFVGIRSTVFTDQHLRDWKDGRFEALFKAAAEQAVPICIYPPGLLGELPALMRRLPDLTLVIDHLGVRQPPLLPAGADWLAELPQLLALAGQRNLYVKVTGFHDLSKEPFPFDDLAAPLRRIVTAFGADRLMWGSDWTRSATTLSYRRAMSYLLDSGALSETERGRLLGGTLREVFAWT
jgi:predicted TIM-barrel fold metal-dependent hydrolase